MTYPDTKRQRIADMSAGTTPDLGRAIARLEAYLDAPTPGAKEEGPPLLDCDIRAVIEAVKAPQFIAIPRLK